MIEKLIDEGRFEEALELLEKEDSEMAGLQRVICHMGLKDYKKVVELGDKLLSNEENKYYYDILSLYVVALIETHNEVKAMAVLESELSMPFVPTAFEPFFRQTYEQLKKAQEAGEAPEKSPYDLYTDDELNQLLMTSTDIDVLAQSISQLDHRNIRNFLATLELILMNVKIPAFLKTIVIELLKNQNVQQEFEYRNGEVSMRIEPTQLPGLYEQQAYQDLKKLVADKLAPKNVSLCNVATDVMTTAMAGLYPVEVSEDEYPYMLAAIEAVSLQMMGQQPQEAELIKKYEVKHDVLHLYIDKINALNNVL